MARVWPKGKGRNYRVETMTITNIGTSCIATVLAIYLSVYLTYQLSCYTYYGAIYTSQQSTRLTRETRTILLIIILYTSNYRISHTEA